MKFFLHPFDSDIALIKLPSALKFSNTIKPVNLACSTSNDSNVIAIGNGLMNSKEKTLAPTLQFAHMKTVSKLKCAPFHPIAAFRDSIICAQGDKKQSICKGDDGGPLIDSKSLSLLGISLDGSCGGTPQIFIRLPKFIQWIEATTGITCRN